MIKVTSSAGSPTALSTITMVTSPAWGTPAAPMLAAVAVTLNPKNVSRKVVRESVVLLKHNPHRTLGQAIRAAYAIEELIVSPSWADKQG